MGQKQTTSWVITFWRRLYSAYQHSPPALPRFRQTFEALEERVVPSSATALLAGGDVQLLFGVNQQKEIIESIASTHHLAANSGRADIEVLQVLEHNPAEEPRGFETHATQMSETMPEVERNPADEHRLFEPPGVQVSEILQVPERNPSEEHRIFEPPAVQQSSSFGPPLESSELPSSYDLRVGDHVTSVKDQGSCGSCWAFATYAALESAILMEEGPVRDFSENHLKNSHGFDVGPCTGGNPTISQAYLTRYHGPVDEVDDPYHPWDDRPSPGGPPQYYVRESAILDTDNEIKNAIMTSGGLYTSMKWDDAYYRPADFTYYYNGSDCSDHAVTIVGWDDTKVTAAPEFGAWLIKNSWGTAFGDNGYFWMSYSDTVGGNVGFSFYDPVAPSEFSRVYYHDEFGYVGGLNTPYAFNAFTPVANEELTAVQFWTQADWAQYDIRIYDTFSGGTLSDLLTSTTGSSAYAGHHTVDLPTGVSLTAGDSFYVYLHIWNGGTYPQAIDIQDPGYNSASTANPGESYYSFDGTIWDDIYSWNPTTNFSIKALTTSDPNQPPIITSLSDSPDPVSSIANLTLTADCVSDPDGTVTSVGFYRESNSLAGLQIGVGGDTLLATDTSGIGGWSVTFNVSGLGEGTYTYYAQATDNDGAKSVAVSTSNTVREMGIPTLTAPAPVTLDSTPTFTWDAVCEATHYEIWVNDLTTGTSAVLWEDSLTGTSWTPTSPL
ncbi:MAG: C1 family peptidase, partial [Gemmataceae bacterium]